MREAPMPGELVPRSSNVSSLSAYAQPSNKLVKRTQNALAELSAELVVSDAKLEGGAFLANTAMNQLGMLTAVAEAVVQMHPAAGQGCSQILNAYGIGAADMIRRTLR
jgi:hypothetical protein